MHSAIAAAERSAAATHFAKGETGAHIAYRPDIDGLRAVAVVPVVLYHVGFSLFGGGFVGVDVFFVISGYLIASLILVELQRGTFTILGFYERRIRRIFPALFATIAASAIAAWFILMPDEMVYFAHSMIATALFGSNFLFWHESGYFDTEALVKPLLHTWSLAVEEQFYIVFPVLLIALGRLPAKRLVLVLFGLWLLSFFASIWAQSHGPLFNFYWSPPRFWELLTGTMLATGAVPRLASRGANQAMALLGLAAIAVAVFGYSEDTSFPGATALLPCFGAAMVIYGGSAPGIVSAGLASRPMVSIGLISYSLYLWHWPLIVFTRYWYGHAPSPATAALIVIASFALAFLSWRFIERPFRGKSGLFARPALFAFAGIAMACSIGFGGFVAAAGGLVSRLPKDAQAVYAAGHDLSHFSSSKCFSNQDDNAPPRDLEANACPIGAEGNGPLDFILWGDSHSAAIAPAIDKIAREHGKRGLFAGRGTCPPLLDFDTGNSKKLKIEQCQQANAIVAQYAGDKHVPAVFMVARWPKYVHRSEYGNEGIFFDPSDEISFADFSAPLIASLDKTLAQLTASGIKPVLIMDVPEMGYDVPQALAKALMTGAKGGDAIAPAREAVRKRQALALQVLTSAVAKYGATLIDPTPAICDEEMCHVQKDGVVLYADEDHLSKSGAEAIAGIFEPYFAAWK